MRAEIRGQIAEVNRLIGEVRSQTEEVGTEDG